MQETTSSNLSKALLQIEFHKILEAQCKLRQCIELNDSKVDEAKAYEGSKKLQSWRVCSVKDDGDGWCR